MKTALLLSGKNSILKFLVSHLKRSKDDLELLATLSRFMVIWAYKFSQLCSKELLEETETIFYDLMVSLSEEQPVPSDLPESSEGSVKQPDETRVLSAGDTAQEQPVIVVESPVRPLREDTKEFRDEISRNLLKVVTHAWPVLLTSEEKLLRWLTIPGKNDVINHSLVSFMFKENPFLKNQFPFQNSTISVIPRPVPKSRIPKKIPVRPNSKNYLKTPKTKKQAKQKKSSTRTNSKLSKKVDLTTSEEKNKPDSEPLKEQNEKFKEKRDYKFDPNWFADWMWNDLRVLEKVLLFFVSKIEYSKQNSNTETCMISIGRVLDRMGHLLANQEGMTQSKNFFKNGFELLKRVSRLNEKEMTRIWGKMIKTIPKPPSCVQRILEELQKREIIQSEEEPEPEPKEEDTEVKEEQGEKQEGNKEEHAGEEAGTEIIWSAEEFTNIGELVAHMEQENLEEYSKDNLNRMLYAFEGYNKQHLTKMWNLENLKAMKQGLQINEKFIFLVWILLHGAFPKSKSLQSLLIQNQKFAVSFFNKSKIIQNDFLSNIYKPAIDNVKVIPRTGYKK